MPCVCESCAQHAQVLGLDQTPRSRSVLHKAYRSVAKLWHPDRYERDPAKRSEAEERFKQIQIAYHELTEHLENPVQWLIEQAPSAHRSPDPFNAVAFHANPENAAPRNAPIRSPISFGNASGYFIAPNFPPIAEDIIAEHVKEPDRALAMVDLSGPASPPASFSRFILFTEHGIFVRDALNLVSLLWYADLGQVRLVEDHRKGLSGLWQRLVETISASGRKYTLEIRHRDGSFFHSIASEVDDSVKKVIYNFLQQRRPEPRR